MDAPLDEGFGIFRMASLLVLLMTLEEEEEELLRLLLVDMANNW